MGARILVIEDVPHNLALITYLLSAYGHEVITSETAEDALTLATEHRPDLVISDLYLPGMDGYAFLAALRKQSLLAATPVIAVTAFAMVGDRDRVLAAGFDGYLTKPIDPQAFQASIAELLPRHLRGVAPIPTPTPDEPAGPAVDTAPPGHPRARILLVDDHDTNLALLRTILEPNRYAVATARSVHDALVTIRRDAPDLVISDVHMNDGTGTELLAALRADPKFATLPFAFSTASESRSETLGQEYNVPVIRQPIDPARLLTQIATILGQ
jgi:two-component system cell cycle response regulator